MPRQDRYGVGNTGTILRQEPRVRLNRGLKRPMEFNSAFGSLPPAPMEWIA